MNRELQTMNSQNKLALWAERISECRSSGQNVKPGARQTACVSRPITSGRDGCLK